jgi:hypothetical protein
MSDQDFVEDLTNRYRDGRKAALDMRAASRTRMICSVIIASFALLNAKPYWVEIAGEVLTGMSMVWLALPWLLASSLLCVIAYFLIGETRKNEEVYFNSILSALNIFNKKRTEKGPEIDEFERVNLQETPAVSMAMKKMNVWHKASRGLSCLHLLVWSVGSDGLS